MDSQFKYLSIKKFMKLYFVSWLVSLVVKMTITPPIASSSTFHVIKYILYNCSMHILLFSLIYLIQTTPWEKSLTFIVPKDSIKLRPLVVFIPFLVSFTVGVFVLYLFRILMPNFNEFLIHNAQSDITFIQTKLGYLFIFIDMVILVPTIEELIFRRILYTILSTTFKTLKAILYTSLFSMLVHGVLSLQIFIFSFLLTLIYHLTGDIRYPIVAHIFNNFMIFLGMVLTDYKILGTRDENIFGVVFVVLGLYSMIWIFKHRSKYISYLSKDSPMERI